MKTLKKFILLVILIGFVGCEKSDAADISVEKYVQQLKDGKYNAEELPKFTYKDIPKLLKYRNETQMIKKFPRNPMSSLYFAECKFGTYILWTIESIRVASIDKKSPTHRFPSLNPKLSLKEWNEHSFESGDDIALEIAAKAYYDWWENNKNKDFNSFKDINPLETTKYRWF